MAAQIWKMICSLLIWQMDWFSICHWATTHHITWCWLTMIPQTNHQCNNYITCYPCPWCHSSLKRFSGPCSSKFKSSISSSKLKSSPCWHFLNNNTTTFHKQSPPLLNEPHNWCKILTSSNLQIFLWCLLQFHATWNPLVSPYLTIDLQKVPLSACTLHSSNGRQPPDDKNSTVLPLTTIWSVPQPRPTAPTNLPFYDDNNLIKGKK